MARSEQEIKEWISTERYTGVCRPYSAADIVRASGTYYTAPKSNPMARKLWSILKTHQANNTASVTFGSLDVVQTIQMSKYLDTVYVSGWQCSSTASSSNEPGPDLADYPMDTVPKKVDQLFRAQLFHDRRLFAAGEHVDVLKPMIADADAGHGGLTAVMKLAKLLVEAGAAGVHIEDQASGLKKCGHMGGKVLVPVQEYIQRVIAIRLQCDIMGAETVIVARTDAEDAKLLQSDIDERDHPFILGSTNEAAGSFRDAVRERRGDKWLEEAGLMTYADAVIEALKRARIASDRFAATSSTMSHSQIAGEVARLGVIVFWSKQNARTVEGYYRVRCGTAYSVMRCNAVLPFADVAWVETNGPSVEQATAISRGVKAVHPSKMLAYNLSPSFLWSKSENPGKYTDTLATLGFVFQFITLAGFHLNALAADEFSAAFSGEGKMLKYAEMIQERERSGKVETLYHQKWSGGDYADTLLSMVTSGTQSTSSMGDGLTEVSFYKQ